MLLQSHQHHGRYALVILARWGVPKYSGGMENCNHNGQHYGTVDGLQKERVSMNGAHQRSPSSCTARAEGTKAGLGLILVRT